MPSKLTWTPRAIIAFLLLVAAGLAGNYFSLSLFFGANFVFGSAAVMVILYFYGTPYGVLAALLVSSYTYVLWHQPYSIITFTCEALCVGLFLRRRSNNMVLLDGMFWLLIGMPSVWLFFIYFMKMDVQAALMIMLKQSINGILNTLVASLAIAYLPLNTWIGVQQEKRPHSLEQSLFNLLVIFVFIPALLIMVMNSRDHFQEQERALDHHLDETTQETSVEITEWMERRLYGIAELAHKIAATGNAPVEALQKDIDIIRSSYPEFHSIYVADAEGTTVAYTLRGDRKGQTTAGLNFSDRPYFAELRTERRPVISDVVMHRRLSIPVVVVSAPVIRNGRFSGYVSGSVDLGHLGKALAVFTGSKGEFRATLRDRHGAVIASTHAEYEPRDAFNKYDGWKREPLRSGSRQLFPPGNLPSMEQWKRSLYMREEPLALGGSGAWTLTMEAPLAQLRDALYMTYIQSMAVMLVLSVLAILVAAVVSRRLVMPLKKLAAVTTDLPSKLSNQQAIDWPASEVHELDYLVQNFKAMGNTLRQKFQEIDAANSGLRTKTGELEKAYADLSSVKSHIFQQEKMASVGQLAAGVAHEINNPVGFIISNLGTLDKYLGRMKEYMTAQADVIRDGAPSQMVADLSERQKKLKLDYILVDAEQLLRESLEGADRVKKIVQNLKSFSRLDEAELKMADINEGIESTLAIVWNELKYKATVKKEYGDIPLTKCNLGHLNQVFMNLLVNAAQAIETRGEITVKTGRENGSIFVSVSDTGCGIPADQMNRIFEPFFTTKKVGKGTGLGLSIAYDIVKKHDGDISVQSKRGIGTTFRVTIPVVNG